jgi:uncharacterized protein (DUF1499 family)
MTLEAPQTVRSAGWSSRLGLFSVALLLVTLLLHRFLALPTPLAINLFLTGLAGAGLALLIGVAALARIWFTGQPGAGGAALGILMGLSALAGPAFVALARHDLPWISDVTTDTANPPAFSALAARAQGANSATYPGRKFAELQTQAYPDLRPLLLDRSPEEAFDLVEEALRRLRWHVIVEEPPILGKDAAPGIIEATEQTLLVGFTDDIVIRITGDATSARVDARSASRYGSFDFGENAQRLRRFRAEVRARAEVTPSAAAAAAAKKKKPGKAAARDLLKRQKGRDQQKAESRNARRPSRSGAQRAPAQKDWRPW